VCVRLQMTRNSDVYGRAEATTRAWKCTADTGHAPSPSSPSVMADSAPRDMVIGRRTGVGSTAGPCWHTKLTAAWAAVIRYAAMPLAL